MIQKQFKEKVLSNQPVAYATGELVISCTDAFLRLYRPGQFAHIKLPCADESLLRRPISINYVDYEKKRVHLVYGIVGKGTKILSTLRGGDSLDVLMPLGNGFNITDGMRKIWLIGGGIGVAPLRSLNSKFPDREYKAFLGFRSKACIYQQEIFSAFADTCIVTDDGSYGDKAFCTDALAKSLALHTPDVILACGPTPFFRSLAKVAGDIPTQVSLDQRMGCGTGGCATCVCEIDGEYRRTCVEGPVFDIRRVGGLYV